MVHPALPRVMQAPIGAATTPDLVVAVSAAGGLGCLAASWTPPPRLREQVRRIGRRLDAPFCVNLVLAFEQSERLELLLEERVPAISFSWGVDAGAIARAREAGATVLVQVGDADAGRRAVAAGADALVAQGVEAGGHVGSRAPLRDLLRGLVGSLPVPVLAAGGVAGADAAAAAVAAGAAGVAAGTAYLAAAEADVHPRYRERLLASDASDTVLTGLFDVGWPDAPHRVLRNRTLVAWEEAGRPAAPSRPGEGETVALHRGRPVVRYSAEQPSGDTDGDVDVMALYAGTGVGAVRRVGSAAEITERLLAAAGP